MTAELTNCRDGLAYMLGKKATFTLVSHATGDRRTYRVIEREGRNGEAIYWVNRLVGPENGTDYEYVGSIVPGQPHEHKFAYRCARGGGRDAVIEWLLGVLQTREQLPEKLSFYTSGECSSCGRLLTVPESIAVGMGPKCRARALSKL
jgi:hypothetical protein